MLSLIKSHSQRDNYPNRQLTFTCTLTDVYDAILDEGERFHRCQDYNNKIGNEENLDGRWESVQKEGKFIDKTNRTQFSLKLKNLWVKN